MDHETAASMLESMSTELWRNETVDDKLRSHLGASLQACSVVVGLVEQHLSEMNDEGQRFQSIIEQEKQVCYIILLRKCASECKFYDSPHQSKAGPRTGNVRYEISFVLAFQRRGLMRILRSFNHTTMT